jgi:hypothetical protein
VRVGDAARAGVERASRQGEERRLRGGFAERMERARPGRPAARSTGAPPPGTERPCETEAGAWVPEPNGDGPSGEGETARLEGPGGDRPGAPPPVPAILAGEGCAPGRAEAMARASGSLLLARAVEHVAVVAAAEGRPVLTVHLGASLSVTLTHGPGGIDVRLEADRGLSPLAEAELPHLVAALRTRGVRVAAAVIRGRGWRGGDVGATGAASRGRGR